MASSEQRWWKCPTWWEKCGEWPRLSAGALRLLFGIGANGGWVGGSLTDVRQMAGGSSNHGTSRAERWLAELSSAGFIVPSNNGWRLAASIAERSSASTTRAPHEHHPSTKTVQQNAAISKTSVHEPSTNASASHGVAPSSTTWAPPEHHMSTTRAPHEHHPSTKTVQQNAANSGSCHPKREREIDQRESNVVVVEDDRSKGNEPTSQSEHNNNHAWGSGQSSSSSASPPASSATPASPGWPTAPRRPAFTPSPSLDLAFAAFERAVDLLRGVGHRAATSDLTRQQWEQIRAQYPTIDHDGETQRWSAWWIARAPSQGNANQLDAIASYTYQCDHAAKRAATDAASAATRGAHEEHAGTSGWARGARRERVKDHTNDYPTDWKGILEPIG